LTTTPSAPPGTPDLLVLGGDVVTMDGERTVWRNGGVAIVGKDIAAVGHAEDPRQRWPEAPMLDARNGLVTPGLVNAYQHLTGDPLLRSQIPDLQRPHDSICGWSVPIHSVHSGDDDELAATLCAVESLRYGTTVAHPLRVAQGMRRAGLCGRVGGWGWDVDGVLYGASAQEVLAR
jgi:5-methylthioadenosine/S-adenosylhomocysteine deaminase